MPSVKPRCVFVLALVGAAGIAMAVNNPPYDMYGYLADDGDNPPVNYMKVCDRGKGAAAVAVYYAYSKKM